MSWLKGLLIVINWLDWLARGYTKQKRKEQHEQIKSDPRAAFKSKFGGVRNDSKDVPSDSADTEVHRDT